jgi:ornithine cyclodeaminase/alanine dehydrogenase-like protein (mu-crystallin family)
MSSEGKAAGGVMSDLTGSDPVHLGDPVYLDAQATYASATIGECADALEEALRAGLPGDADPPRQFMDLPNGEMLMMPSRVTGTPTIKIVTILHDPDGPGERIKGVHVVCDPVSLAPRVIMDAAALTVIRTTAISIVALRAIARKDSQRLVIFGAGPQGVAHLDAIAAEWPLQHVTVVARRSQRAEAMVAAARQRHPKLLIEAVASHDSPQWTQQADIIVCATTATTPVFDDPGHDVTAIAIGGHSPTGRELPGELVARSFIAVEDREAALREAGDIVIPINDGLITADDISADLTDLVTTTFDLPGSRVFKSMGMGWEDAVVSARIAR